MPYEDQNPTTFPNIKVSATLIEGSGSVYEVVEVRLLLCLKT